METGDCGLTDLIMSQLLRRGNEDGAAHFTLRVGKQVAVLLYHLIYCREERNRRIRVHPLGTGTYKQQRQSFAGVNAPLIEKHPHVPNSKPYLETATQT